MKTETTMKNIRKAAFAGSWYEKRHKPLKDEIEGYLKNASGSSSKQIRALIGPHAGLYYSGRASGHAYKLIDPSSVKRVFLLGPSHRKWVEGCAVSRAEVWETPLGSMPVDTNVVSNLLKNSEIFTQFELDEEEDEHSLELHMPFIRHVFPDSVKLVPIIVGDIDSSMGNTLGSIFGPYLESDENFFVISSDFCHWGSRFGYTPYDKSKGQIWESIKAMDHEGMSAIESMDHAKFRSYIKKTQNTICGRMPITILLHSIQYVKEKGSGDFKLKFVYYDQSSKVRDPHDSSVSYAAGVLSSL